MIRKEKLEQLKEIVESLKVVDVQERKVEPEKKFLQSECYQFKLQNGILIPREKLIKGGKDGSACIIVPKTNEEEFLVAIEPRVFTELTVGVGFPAGYIELGEKPYKAALRELQEETGYASNQVSLLDTFYQDEGCSAALNHIYLAENTYKVGEQSLDKDEIIEYMFFNLEELEELEDLGYIKGCNTKIALEKVKKLEKR